jgi:hypothetical protein
MDATILHAQWELNRSRAKAAEQVGGALKSDRILNINCMKDLRLPDFAGRAAHIGGSVKSSVWIEANLPDWGRHCESALWIDGEFESTLTHEDLM